MTEVCEVKELQRGDHVVLEDGSVAIVKDCFRQRIFDGYAFEVVTDMGSQVLDGHDKIRVHN